MFSFSGSYPLFCWWCAWIGGAGALGCEGTAPLAPSPHRSGLWIQTEFVGLALPLTSRDLGQVIALHVSKPPFIHL